MNDYEGTNGDLSVTRPLLLACSLALAGCASSDVSPPPSAAQASIPFVSSVGISEWRIAGRGMLYVKSISGDWYFIRTMNVCSGLDSAIGLGFVTSALDQLDYHGAVIADRERCPIQSIIRSNPPPLHRQTGRS